MIGQGQMKGNQTKNDRQDQNQGMEIKYVPHVYVIISPGSF